MTINECEQLQDDIVTYMDGWPDILITRMCQAIVDYYRQQIDYKNYIESRTDPQTFSETDPLLTFEQFAESLKADQE